MSKAVIVTALLVSGAAALAQAPAAPESTKIGPNGNPHQVICRNETEIGSRLNRRRVCRTRAEWAEHQKMFRENIERAQQQSQTQVQ